jgi:hypothetical protein
MNTCTATAQRPRSSRAVLGDRTIERTNSEDKLVGFGETKLKTSAPRRSKKPSSTSKKAFIAARSVDVKAVNVKRSDDSVSTVSMLSLSSSEFDSPLVVKYTSKKSSSKSSSKKSSKLSSKKSSKGSSSKDAASKDKLLMFNNRNLEWMKDGDLTSTDVFHLHLNRPAVVIQAAVRRFLERQQYRNLQEEALQFHEMIMRHQAAMEIQDAVRAWLANMKQQVATLTSRFAAIHLRHQNELREIEENKQRFMQSVYQEIQQEMKEQDERQELEHKENFELLGQLKKDNQKLRKQNKTLRKANVMMVDKNQKAMNDLAQIEVNIEHMENVIIPRLEADSKMGEQVCGEWLDNVQLYENAIAEYDAKFQMEKRIRQVVQNKIHEMADHVDQEEDYEPEVKDSVHQLVVAL